MELTDLKQGDRIILEIKWGERPYQIKTAVVGTGEGAILIKPFTYKGTVLDLTSIQFHDMLYNIYCVDQRTGSRLVWHNVQIETQVYKKETYYVVRPSAARLFPSLSERRQHKRMLLNRSGSVLLAKDGPGFPVKVHDVSDNGVSFVMQAGIDFPGKVIRIGFDDEIRGHGFHLQIDCRIVRRQEHEQAELIGCRIVQTNRDFLAYICLKRMEFEAQLKQERAGNMA